MLLTSTVVKAELLKCDQAQYRDVSCWKGKEKENTEVTRSCIF